MELDHIFIGGAREHNLRSVDVRVPKKKLVILTGVSGSGKSSLAFDTLYAEGQRRYVESLSAYARQFLGQMDKPAYDVIRGLSPTIAIEQKTTGSNPRSTVGTITEIADYLRVLYARIGVQHCHRCGAAVLGQSPEQIATELFSQPVGTRAVLLAPVLVNRKGEHRELLAELRGRGFVRIRDNGAMRLLDETESLEKRRKHTMEVAVDRLVLGPDIRPRLIESVEQALEVGGGMLLALLDPPKPSPAERNPGGEREEGQATAPRERSFSTSMACQECSISFPELTPQSFSFNSPQGMCVDCNGLGSRMQVDPALVVPDEGLSLDEGAVRPWGTEISKKAGWSSFRAQILTQLGIQCNVPWRRLRASQREQILHGTGGRRYPVEWIGKSGRATFQSQWEGAIPRLLRRFLQTGSERAKHWYGQFLADSPCTGCGGTRLRPESAAVRVAGRSFCELSAATIEEARDFFARIDLQGAARTIAAELLKEIRGRLDFLVAVGLSYLTLDRAGPSLSGGEAQRIRLASQVGSELTGVTYVLDEPSIGLHARDHRQLLATLRHLRNLGNTVVVVEHDEATIRSADHVIDFGPGAGTDGGQVVHAGTPASLARCRPSLTGAYLSGRRQIPVPERRRTASGALKILGARENNLRDVDVELPLGVLVAITGVSGAGKSTLVNDILLPALARTLQGSLRRPGRHRRLLGTEQLDKVIHIDQRPIGRTPRSNPVTYVKVFDDIRRCFATLPEARVRGYAPGRFSFNLPGGRCEACRGDGVRRIEMHFLPDVYVRCESCHGKRFNGSTLAVRYRGQSIADVLDLTVREARELFSAHPQIAQALTLLADVGLDYLRLGQPSPTLSGGEAQRIKLARELAKRGTGRTLYLLDEPTTGLHFEDLRKLLTILGRLIDAGNSAFVIEHNMDVIKTADWIVDLGPEGGPAGGRLVAAGTPEQVAGNPASHTGRYLAPLLGAGFRGDARPRRPKRAPRPRPPQRS